MRRFSYILSFLTVAVALFFTGSVAKADTVDPHIGLGGGGSCTETPFSETSLTQSFSGLQTGCINDFVNNIPGGELGMTLFQLVVTVAGGPFTLTCDVLEGSPLTGDAFQSSPNSCTFSSPTDAITPGFEYGLTFDRAFGSTVDITLSQAVITPEPASIVLLGTGLAALVARRKKLA